MEQLLESGSSGLQAVAQALGLTFSGSSTFMTSADSFLRTRSKSFKQKGQESQMYKLQARVK
jgi:hypothetical protein